MDYLNALDYIYSFTDYEKEISYRYSPDRFDLGRMERLLALVENPHLRFDSIHVAGTKGKGSTSAMIASILQCAGYKTGLYTSPHLHTFRERIRIDGSLIPKEKVANLIKRLRPSISQVEGVTTFEVITALAFLYFAQEGVDFAVLEVGLGGRLDATNVVIPLVSVITSLSYDHTQVLGDTLEKIAYEKAGIIKEGVPVVSAPQEEEAISVIEEVCRKKKANLVLVGRDWIWEQGEADLDGQEFGIKRRDARGEVGRFWIPLIGKHQLINATVAIASIHQLHRYGIAIPERSIEEGLRLVRWPGRLEILGREPFVVLDCAHNPDSARKLAEALRDYFSYERLLLVFGASADKDIAGMLKALLPLAERIFFTKAKHPRAADTHSLVREALAQGREAFQIQSVSDALCFALREANPQDLVCVTGSIFVVAEAKEAWLERKGDEMPERD